MKLTRRSALQKRQTVRNATAARTAATLRQSTELQQSKGGAVPTVDALEKAARATKLKREPDFAAHLPTFTAVGLGMTGATVLIAAVAYDQRGVGVELRELVTREAGFNTREDMLHTAAKLDRAMNRRYPGMQTMSLADELLKVLEPIGSIENVLIRGEETVRTSKRAPIVGKPQPDREVTDYQAMLSEDAPWQVHSADLENTLRSYLKHLEEMDKKNGISPPRVTLYMGYRPVNPLNDKGEALSPEALAKLDPAERGLWVDAHNNLSVSIEQVERGTHGLVRMAGTVPISLGAPTLVGLFEGSNGADPPRLGVFAKPVSFTNVRGRLGEVVPGRFRAFSGRLSVPVGGLLRNVLVQQKAPDGSDFWLHHQLVGGKKERGVWLLLEIAARTSFDPIAAGLLPEGTAPDSAEYRAQAQLLKRKAFIEAASVVLDKPVSEVENSITFGPNEFAAVQKMADHVLVAANAMVGGDGGGSGMFGFGGAMTGMISQVQVFIRHFQAVADGADFAESLKTLENELLAASQAWVNLGVSSLGAPDPKLFEQGGEPADRTLPVIGCAA